MIVDSSNPPPLVACVFYWERTLDPWHAEAFPQEFKQSAPNQGPRAEGWGGIDHAENEIVFIADGTEYPDHDDKYRIENGGPYNRLCAIPVNSSR